MDVEFRLLGPLEILVGGKPVRNRGRKQAALLVLLLLDANDLVPAERLIEDLWGERAPETAANTLQVYVSQLRKLLGSPQMLAYRAPGYVLAVDPEAIDVRRFEALAAEGRAALAAGDAAGAAGRLRAALALSRGSPLADFAFEPWAQAEIGRLEELVLATLEERIEADLALGRHGELVVELEGLTAAHPTRERLRGQLMLALYRAGRQADALQVYQETRATLVGDLGIDPGPELQRLERAILRQDPALDVAVAAAPAPRAVPAAPPREVRKRVTVVFSALAVPDAGDPEVYRSLAARAQDAVAEALARHGGSVEQLPGETVMGVFGVPAVHEDDPLRAVRGALDARAALDSLGVGATLRAGVGTGEVIAADGGATGDAVTAAARLKDVAEPGEILLRDETRQALHAAVRVERARDGGNPAWRLVEVEPDAAAIARRLDTPIVGRERELAELERAFERCVRESSASLFTVVGAAGIGKSRLAHELARAVGPGVRFLSGRCLSYGESVTFQPLADVVRQAVGDDVRGGLRELLAGEARGEEAAIELEAALGLGDAPARGQTAWAVRRLLETLARDGPVVVVVDDVQWAAPTFLDLVEEVVDWLRSAPVLVVCLARPELLDVRPGFGTRAHAATLQLEPLSPHESEELVANLAADGDARLRGRVITTAEGNPLFIEQMLATLEEDGTDSVPPTIQGLLAARLDRLPLAERRVLERGSVCGKEFAFADVEHLTPEPERAELDAALRPLVRKQLLAPGYLSALGEEGYSFHHGMIRDAAYESLPKRVRAELHERFADRLEAQAADRLPDLHELVGFHLEQAYRYRSELGQPHAALAARAAAHLGPAARRASRRGDPPAAASLARRALALLGHDDPARPVLLLVLADSLRDMAALSEALTAVGQALDLARERGDEDLERRARTIELRLRIRTDAELPVAELLERVRGMIPELEELGDDAALADAWGLVAYLLWIRCRAGETAEAADKAVRYGRAGGVRRIEMHALTLALGAVLYGPTPVREAVRFCEEVAADPSTPERVAASAWRALAGLRMMEGDFGEARRLLELDRAVAEELGLRIVRAVASEQWADLGMLSGDLELAEERLREAYGILAPMGEKSGLSTLVAILAEVLYRMGRYDEALAATEESDDAAPPDDVSAQVQWRTARAKVLAARGGHAEAEALAREAVALAETTDFANLRALALLALAEVLAAAGSDARASVDAALELLERKGNVAGARRARERFGV